MPKKPAPTLYNKPFDELAQPNSFRDTRFWIRLEACEKAASGDAKDHIEKLKSNVSQVTAQAKWIGEQIHRFLPQYTLHNERHYLNVLGIMDALLPAETIAQLSPLECALCILTAYTHDLGMALSADDVRDLQDENSTSEKRKAYLSHRDTFGEEVRQIERLEKTHEANWKQRVELIEGHILGDYIRVTHANDAGRIGFWLDAIAKECKNKALYEYAGKSFRHELELIGASHGKDASWLREQLCKQSTGNATDFLWRAGGNDVNFALPGLLLRLADYLDFDASRTPTILFRHIGIENDDSLREWRKHMAVDGWELETATRPATLHYYATCPHPAIEKSIRTFLDGIARELGLVAGEHDFQTRLLGDKGKRYALNLPAHVRHSITPQGYSYHDIEFRLDQDEILQLLMGESLYGDPSLCIRELLQNAIDAVELRDLRLKLPRNQRAEPTDALEMDNGTPEPLEVHLTWGHDEQSGQDYIRVTDHGVGMTRKVIEKYFTQIGKSFYRSPEYEQEKALLRRNNQFTSPISQFGIGILSCFMIADHMEVRTRPGGANHDDRKPSHVTISGPGSLFWIKDDTDFPHQGTEITLYLKSKFEIQHESEIFLKAVKEQVGINRWSKSIYEDLPYNEDKKGKITIIDPAFVAAHYIVWPLYPVRVGVPKGDEIVLDEAFQRLHLMLIDQAAVKDKAAQWGCPPEMLGEPQWGWHDWVDNKGEQATGSRIRLWFPQHKNQQSVSELPYDSPNFCRQFELAAFTTTQIKRGTTVFIKGLHVEYNTECMPFIQIAHGIGGNVWIDLRGSVSPRLTTNRDRAFLPAEGQEWESEFDALFKRFGESLKDQISFDLNRNLRCCFSWHQKLQHIALGEGEPKIGKKNTFSFLSVLLPTWRFPSEIALIWNNFLFLQSLASIQLLYHQLDPRFDMDVPLARERNRDWGLASSLELQHRELELDMWLGMGLRTHDVGTNAAKRIHYYSHYFQNTRWLARKLASALDDHVLHALIDHVCERGSQKYQEIFEHSHSLASPFVNSLACNLLNEMFLPNFENSYPPLELFTYRGFIGNALLSGPGLVEIETESDGRTVHPMDLAGKLPVEINLYGYDLVFPITAVPLGQLRRQCPNWRTTRNLRPVGVLPFLLPGNDEIWQKNATKFQELFKVDRIYALMPRIELWDTPFADWKAEDWQTCGLSVLWEIPSGQVLWANGAQKVDDMHHVGLPIEEFIKQQKS